jgi:sirohydrochlorin ferrochelatase
VQFVPWAVAFIASIAAGTAACGLLVSRRAALPFLLAIELGSMTVLGIALDLIWTSAHRPDVLIASVAIALGAAVGGYALHAGVIAARTVRPPADVEWTLGPMVAGVHVVVLSDEEPTDYDPAAVTSALMRYAEGDVHLPPEVGRPLIYASERSRYRHAGGSTARATVRSVAETLQAALGSGGAPVTVWTAFCEGETSLPETVARIVAAGGRSIVVVALAVAWSRAFTEAFDGLPLALLAAQGVTIEKAQPLWPSSRLSSMLAARTIASLDGELEHAGVILLSEGDSWEHARSQEAYREQLVFFTQRVRSELVDSGVPASRIRRASLWLGEPDVTEAARHLAAVGARRIVLVPASFACETIATRTDLPYAAERAQADTGTIVTTVLPWGNDPAVIDALREAVAGAPLTDATELRKAPAN